MTGEDFCLSRKRKESHWKAQKQGKSKVCTKVVRLSQLLGELGHYANGYGSSNCQIRNN
jgi:hypothetical protein